MILHRILVKSGNEEVYFCHLLGKFGSEGLKISVAPSLRALRLVKTRGIVIEYRSRPINRSCLTVSVPASQIGL